MVRLADPGHACALARAAGLLAVLLLALGGPPVSPARAEDAIGGDMVVTKDMKPWEGCGECHDLDGVAPNGHFPNLAAQNVSYLRKEMADFAQGQRSNDHGQMGTSAEEATGTRLDRIIAYFATLPAPPPARAPDLSPSALARAEALIAEGDPVRKIPSCANCHGAQRKHWFDSPWLEAQQAAYLAKQLDDFRTGARANDPSRSMPRLARLLSDDDIAALAGYFASQPRPGPPPSLPASRLK